MMSQDTKEQSMICRLPILSLWGKNSGLLFSTGQDAGVQGLAGRKGTLLRTGAPSNDQMETKEDEKRVEAGCGLLTFWVSILDPLHGIFRVDAISKLLWRSPEMGSGIWIAFWVLHWSFTRKSALALTVKTLSEGVAWHCALPANTEKMSIIKPSIVQDHSGLQCRKYLSDWSCCCRMWNLFSLALLNYTIHSYCLSSSLTFSLTLCCFQTLGTWIPQRPSFIFLSISALPSTSHLISAAMST